MPRARELLSQIFGRYVGSTPAAQETAPTRPPISAPILQPRHARVPFRAIPVGFETHDRYPDHVSLEASADPQDGCPLFSVLPPEVRELVYGYMWRTGGHLYGIHVLKDSERGQVRTWPCSLHPANFEDVAEAEAKLDALLDGMGVDEAEKLRGLRLGTQVSGGPLRELVGDEGERVQQLMAEMVRTHWECDDDRVYGPKNSARFRTGEGVDPSALWSPFLPVLLVCKRIYLEAVGTIFRDVPPIIDPRAPYAAGFLLGRFPHPSISNLQTITLSSDRFIPGANTPGNGPMTMVGFDGAPKFTWHRAFNALARIPSLREIRLSLRIDPPYVHLGDVDLRPMARCAGPLAAKFVVHLMPPEHLVVNCRVCLKPPKTFILPAGNAGGARADGVGTPVGEGGPLPLPDVDESEIPSFGKVIWHAAPRYVVFTDSFPPEPPLLKARPSDVCETCLSRRSHPDLPMSYMH